jgi:2-polyprenyl-6-hydroxyphenyl methylase/3-demethylubiquinone-9 3-methyltransferase
MMSHIPPAAPLCKCCQTQTGFFAQVDLHNNAKLNYGYYSDDLLPSGVMLDYYVCAACGYIFTPFMDMWIAGDFATYIYNKDYPRIDGSYNGFRAGACANIFYLAFHDYLKELSFLDYGGGIGVQSALMQAFGVARSLTYDPFATNASVPDGTFHVVSCLEVLEHTTDPKKTIADLVRFSDPDSGLIFVTTECTPDDIHAQKGAWWYLNPRVGHISFYALSTIDRLFAEHDYHVIHVERHTHVAFKKWPVWAAHFLTPYYRPKK